MSLPMLIVSVRRPHNVAAHANCFCQDRPHNVAAHSKSFPQIQEVLCEI